MFCDFDLCGQLLPRFRRRFCTDACAIGSAKLTRERVYVRLTAEEKHRRQAERYRPLYLAKADARDAAKGAR